MERLSKWKSSKSEWEAKQRAAEEQRRQRKIEVRARAALSLFS